MCVVILVCVLWIFGGMWVCVWFLGLGFGLGHHLEDNLDLPGPGCPSMKMFVVESTHIQRLLLC